MVITKCSFCKGSGCGCGNPGDCPYCAGKGIRKSANQVLVALWNKARTVTTAQESRDVQAQAAAAVAGMSKQDLTDTWQAMGFRGAANKAQLVQAIKDSTDMALRRTI